jgi:hypothetical protein
MAYDPNNPELYQGGPIDVPMGPLPIIRITAEMIRSVQMIPAWERFDAQTLELLQRMADGISRQGGYDQAPPALVHAFRQISSARSEYAAALVAWKGQVRESALAAYHAGRLTARDLQVIPESARPWIGEEQTRGGPVWLPVVVVAIAAILAYAVSRYGIDRFVTAWYDLRVIALRDRLITIRTQQAAAIQQHLANGTPIPLPNADPPEEGGKAAAAGFGLAGGLLVGIFALVFLSRRRK